MNQKKFTINSFINNNKLSLIQKIIKYNNKKIN